MAPPKKKKKEQVAEVPPGTGVIRFEVNNVSKLDNMGQFSHEIELDGVSWRANVDKWGEDDIAIHLHCMHNQTTPWRMKVNAERILINEDSSKNITETEVITFDDVVGDPVFWKDMVLGDFMDEKKGFIKNDTITVEVRFFVVKTENLRLIPLTDFTDPNEPCHNVALLINGEKIHACKQILAAHSPVFKAMFFGNFNEKDKKEIEMQGIDREEFVELLHQIYPSSKKVAEHSVENLLKLADRFQITSVIDRCEKFLSDSKNRKSTEKLRLADKFRLPGLLAKCISSLNEPRQFDKLEKSSIFRDLSDATKEILFKRMLERWKTDCGL